MLTNRHLTNSTNRCILTKHLINLGSKTMKLTELLDKKDSNFDAKNKLNKGSGIVNSSIIEQIESGGITSELLDSFPFPVFRYRTQITLHGTFNTEQDSFYTGGYKKK